MLDVNRVRSHFPGLRRPAVFFDNPAGTQIAQTAIDRIQQYLVETNANHGGVFATSRESDAVVDQARQMSADFLWASRAEEVILEPNVATLTLHDVTGRLVRTLVERSVDAGSHLVEWDGTDNGGTPVGSGIYFYEMKAGTYASKRQMTLLK